MKGRALRQFYKRQILSNFWFWRNPWTTAVASCAWISLHQEKSRARMWELDRKEGWAQKNWGFQTVVLEKTRESPLDCKEIQAVHPKQNQPWRFIARTDAEAETPILCPPEAKKWKRKYWGQEKKGATEDEMTGWHHRLNGHAFEQTPGAGDGHGGLARCSPWGHRESDTTQWLNNNISFLGMLVFPPLQEYLSTGERFQMLILGSTYLLPHKGLVSVRFPRHSLRPRRTLRGSWAPGLSNYLTNILERFVSPQSM